LARLGWRSQQQKTEWRLEEERENIHGPLRSPLTLKEGRTCLEDAASEEEDSEIQFVSARRRAWASGGRRETTLMKRSDFG